MNSDVESGLSTWFVLRKNPEVTYSSWSGEGRTSVIVAWKSSTGVDALTHRSSVAGPTMVVALEKGAVGNRCRQQRDRVQSQSGSADHAFPFAGRLVKAGSRVEGERRARRQAAAGPPSHRPPRGRAWSVVPAGGQLEKSAE